MAKKSKYPNSTKADILAQAAAKADFSSDDLRTIRIWLADQLVAQKHAKLGQGGHTNTQVPLRQVFVDLPIASIASADAYEDERTCFLSNMLAAKPLDLRSAFKARKETSSTSISDIEGKEEQEEEEDECDIVGEIEKKKKLSRWGAVLLIGGPGQGKSTLGQLACQLHRVALLHPVVEELTGVQRDLIHTFMPPGESNKLKLPNLPLLPIQIVLPDFAAWVANKASTKTTVPLLLQFLADLPSAKELHLDAAKLLKLICVMPSLLVLDGFDEVGATQDRLRIVAAAQELLMALSEKAAFSQILATTRPQGYADELSQAGINFQKIFLTPLTRDEALVYAKKLIEAKIFGADQQAKALKQIHEAADEPATERLLTTPLQVTILTALVQQLGRAPRERWMLFSRYFAYTFDREIERGTYASPLLAEHRSHIERIHARVALLLQVEAERDGGASARMSRLRLEEVITEVLAEDEVAKEQRDELVRDIASAAENRLVFLVEPEPGKFGFEIRSLQEFMAAWALTSGRDAEVEARLYQVSKAPMFKNVALFISSRFFSEVSPLRDTLADSVCVQLNEDISDELSSISRAGSLLALETLEEGAALSQPKRARALMSKASGLLALPPSIEHVRLARVANEDTYSVLQQVINLGLGSSTKDIPFCAASAWVCIIDATNRQESWATELAKRYWKPDAASTNLFESLSRIPVILSDWLCEGIESIAQSIKPDTFIDIPKQRVNGKSHSSWASWLTSVYGGNNNWRYRNRTGFISIASSGKQRSEGAPPEYPCPDSDWWRAWVAAAIFDCTPTAKNLAAALESLAKCKDLEYWKRLEWRASWPLGVCIASANESHDLIQQAEMIRMGHLGDTEIWEKAEKIWEETLDINSSIAITEESMPWTLTSIAIAPPIFAIPVWGIINRFKQQSKKLVTPEFILKANELFLNSRSQKLRKRLAEICLAASQQLSAKNKQEFSNYISWVSCVPSASSYLVPRPKGMTIKVWESLLEACDKKSNNPWLVDSEGVFKALQRFPSNSALIHLAVRTVRFHTDNYAFRHAINLETASMSVAALDSDTITSPETLGSLAILKILVGLHPKAQDFDLLNDISKASEIESNIWSILLEILQISKMSRDRINSILIRVFKLLGPDHNSSHYAIKEIRNSLQKRTSDLDSRATWDRLALPLPYPTQPLQGKFNGGIPSNPVRIERIDIQEVGGIEKLQLDLAPPPQGLGQWTIIIGPNGVGKTTLLRSIVLALRSVKHPSIWPKGAFSSQWQRISLDSPEKKLDSQISLTLGDGIEHRTLIRPSTSIGISQLPEQDQPYLFPIFAYGCRRGSALGGTARQVNLTNDDGPEVATLFDEGSDLIQAETWLVALEGDTSKNEKSKIIFENVIDGLKSLMKIDSIKVLNQKLWVSDKNGVDLPFSCLSDGYLTNAGWFLDLIARWITLADRHGLEIGKDFLKQMRGLVLIDEIDLHLHPQWQIEIISRTRALLPEMSFIATTHNPLTLVGAAASEVWILENRNGTVAATAGIENPMLLSGGQIYQKYFGISDIFPDKFGRLLQRFGYLSGYAMRNDEEESELQRIKTELNSAGIDPGWDVIPRSDS